MPSRNSNPPQKSYNDYRPTAIKSTAEAKRNEDLQDLCLPHLSGNRALLWIRLWDGGVKSSRVHILEAFVGLHMHSNCSAMESDLGDAAPLLFTRIMSWLSLTYKALKKAPKPKPAPLLPPVKCNSASLSRDAALSAPKPASRSPVTGHLETSKGAGGGEASEKPVRRGRTTPLLLLIQSIMIFVRGASYITQFVEGGMTLTLTDSLECGTQATPLTGVGVKPQVREHQLLTVDERTNIVLLLLYISNAGRVYREMICDGVGLVQLFHTLQREETEELCVMLTDLFVQLGEGNPRIAPFIHCGLVRIILCHCRPQQAAIEEGCHSGVPEGERSIHKRLAGCTGLECTVSDSVAFHAARALHYLQITIEEHHFAHCQNELGMTATAGAQQSVDQVPVVGLRAAPEEGGEVFVDSDPLLSELSFPEFLDALLYLTLHDNTRFRVEGSELLALAAKNTLLTRHILSRCFEVLDDDVANITDDEDAERISRRQRLQMACGRAAVQIILSKPMSEDRRTLILNFIALRGAHISLLKYLRMSDAGDTAAVHDCCRAIQIVARASHAKQRAEIQQTEISGFSPLMEVGLLIHDAVGDALYQMLLHEELTEDESAMVLRAAQTAKILVYETVDDETGEPVSGKASKSSGGLADTSSTYDSTVTDAS